MARWTWRRKQCPRPGQAEADAALARAEAERQATAEQTPEVAESAAAIREVRLANHFAERIRTSMGGGV